MDALMQELKYLREHHDMTHHPAAKYQLLLDYLNGVPTLHGDCPVHAEIERLRALVRGER